MARRARKHPPSVLPNMRRSGETIEMRVAALAGGLFLAAFLLHWILWRIRIPRRQTAILLLIFLGTLPAGLIATMFLPWASLSGPLAFWRVLHISIFHVGMSLAYVVAYSAIEERSPSMTVLTHVADARSEGRAREEIVATLNATAMVDARLSALLRDHMIEEWDGSYSLTTKGRIWATAFSSWRRLLNFEKGG